MNPLLTKLQPYPFERLKQLFQSITPNPVLKSISLGIGEPKHATPEFIKTALSGALNGLAAYPATAGEPALREVFAAWLMKRYALAVNPVTQVLPVNGSREALFAFTQVIVDPTKTTVKNGVTELPIVVCPNPFYQIYEGAALLAGAEPYYVNSDPARNFGVDWDKVPAEIWERTQMIFVCSPGNPAGAVMPLDEWQKLFALSDRYGFVIASDECYSEIYFQDGVPPPLGGLEAAQKCVRNDFKNIVSFTSLSKRSNVPGMRSGFVAGDAAIMKQFALYRTYHGSAMSLVVQAASKAAWSDEEHVIANRALYRDKFMQVTPLLAEVLEVALPDAGFYLWAKIPAKLKLDDAGFAKALLEQYNVTVLPGSYLAREADGINPGDNFIRMALVATTEECVEAAQRIVQFVKSL
jgi:N-succinyldiaminopimelate aminotransferase